MTDAIGWASALVLFLTLAKQVHQQWRAPTVEGVSRWLMWGQGAASLGFTVYSWQVRNWVFTTTNFLCLITSVIGSVIYYRKRGARRAATG